MTDRELSRAAARRLAILHHAEELTGNRRCHRGGGQPIRTDRQVASPHDHAGNPQNNLNPERGACPSELVQHLEQLLFVLRAQDPLYILAPCPVRLGARTQSNRQQENDCRFLVVGCARLKPHLGRTQMSRWDEQFQNHPAVQAVARLQSVLEGLSPADADALAEVERLRKIAAYVRAALNRADPELVSEQTLNEIGSSIGTVTNAIENFKNDPNIAYIQSANNDAAPLLYAAGRLPVPIEPGDFDDMRERASSYRRSVGQFLHQIEDEVRGAHTNIDEVRSHSEGIRTESDSEVGRLSARVEELIATIGQQEARLDNAVARVEEQFSNAEAQRAQRFEELTNDTRKEGTELVQELRQATTEQLGLITQDADTTLEELNKQVEDARTLVATLGAIGVSGGYGEYARKQEKSANVWRLVVVGSLAVLAIAALVSLWTLPSGGIDWEHFATRLFATGSLVALAGYAANQSTKHRRAEREARKAEIELAALDPYLALFDAAERNKIKAEVALRMFGQPLAPDSAEVDRVGALQLLDLLRTVLSNK
jgi:hypothetical protein